MNGESEVQIEGRNSSDDIENDTNEQSRNVSLIQSSKLFDLIY